MNLLLNFLYFNCYILNLICYTIFFHVYYLSRYDCLFYTNISSIKIYEKKVICCSKSSLDRMGASNYLFRITSMWLKSRKIDSLEKNINKK